MDREKLKEKKEKISKWSSCHIVKNALLEIIDALLEDDKPKTATEVVMKEEIEKELEEISKQKINFTIIKYNWTPKELQAIKESIIHWRDNVSRLKLADELGVEIMPSPLYAVWLTKVPLGGLPKRIALFSSNECALCGLFFPDCNDCPLTKIGNRCIEDSSTYRKCGKARGNQEIISSAENMVQILEGLLE